MSIRPIVTLGHPVLRTPAASVVVDASLAQLLKDLEDTVQSSQGLGLAAPQINEASRAIIVRIEDKLIPMLNPEILESSGSQTAEEGCLSLPGVSAPVTRSQYIQVKFLTPEGDLYTKNFEGLAARIIQHEVDHLNGILFFDHLHPIKRSQLLKKWKIASRRAR